MMIREPWLPHAGLGAPGGAQGPCGAARSRWSFAARAGRLPHGRGYVRGRAALQLRREAVRKPRKNVWRVDAARVMLRLPRHRRGTREGSAPLAQSCRGQHGARERRAMLQRGLRRSAKKARRSAQHRSVAPLVPRGTRRARLGPKETAPLAWWHRRDGRWRGATPGSTRKSVRSAHRGTAISRRCAERARKRCASAARRRACGGTRSCAERAQRLGAGASCVVRG